MYELLGHKSQLLSLKIKLLRHNRLEVIEFNYGIVKKNLISMFLKQSFSKSKL